MGNANVSVVEGVGAGTDEVRTALATLSIAGFTNVENLTYTGAAAFTGTGNAGDNIITGGIGNDILTGGAGADQLVGGSGTDTASYANAATGVIVDLKTGAHAGEALGDTYSSIEKFQGSGFTDFFTASSAAEAFEGGSGSDTVNYGSSAAAVTVSLSTGIGSGGDAAGDTYTTIDRIIGSAFADTLTASTISAFLEGGNGDDVYILGNAGVTVVEGGGSGTDEVRTALATLSIANFANVENLTYTGSVAFTGTGNSGSNIITGGIGNDILIGGAGADQLVGGSGTDTASYSTATAGVIVNLKTGINAGDAAGDTFSSIEKFQGSGFADTFVSSISAEAFDGGSSVDTVNYATSSAGVTVNLPAGTGSGGDAAGDTYTSIERVIGSAFADTITASAANAVLEGGSGDDIYTVSNSGISVVEAASAGTDEVRTALAALSIAGYANVENLTYTGSVAFTGTGNSGNNVITGGIGDDILIGGAGADQLVGGSGTDTASYSTANTAVTINLKTGANLGDAAGDTYSSIERYEGSNLADTFISGAAADNFRGGIGSDTVDYSTAAAAVTVDLTAGTGSAGEAAGDVYSSIERVIGSAFADTLTASLSTHIVEGGAGNDTYNISSNAVAVVEGASAGTDEVRTALATFTLASYANVENLTYTGAVAFNGTGNADNNVITGGGANDILTGGAGADSLNGAGGTDIASYSGSASAITLDLKGATSTGDAAGDSFTSIEQYQGSGFDDIFISGTNADNFAGGSGTDTIDYSTSSAAVTVDLLAGTGSGGDAAGDVYSSVERVLGTGLDDTLTGSANADQLLGQAGNDTLNGGDGNDILEGGAGSDALNGGLGTDSVSYANSSAAVTVDLTLATASGGEAAGDTLSSIEQVTGSAFADTLSSATSGHTLRGGAGNDTYVVGSTGVTIVEGASAGTDEVRTGLAALSIATAANVENLTYTGASAFTGTGNSGANIITGGIGNDILIGGGGADQLIGGSGTDTASYTDTSAGVTLNLKAGVHTGDAAGDTFSSIERYQGSTGADTFVSSAAADYLDGAGGTDTVDYSTSASAVIVDLTAATASGGDAAGDTLVSIERVIGTTGADTLSSAMTATTLEGGGGNDIYTVGNTGVTVVENASAGTDEVRTALAALSIATFANVENLTYTGAAAFTGTGNATNNILTGGGGNDILIGGAGADQLIGAGGTDTASYSNTSSGVTLNFKTGILTGDAAGDTFSSIEKYQGSAGDDIFVGTTGGDSFDGFSGSDTIDYSTSASAVTVNLTTAAVSGGDATGDVLVGFEKVIGTNFADSLTSGTAGHILAGGAGDDLYFVTGSGVSLIEAASAGTDEVRTTQSVLSLLSSPNIENLTYQGAGAFTGTGNASANIITGSTGNDILIGDGGADQLIGGGGTDTASYISSAVGVTINLKANIFSGDAVGDVYSSIEKFQGSLYNDLFVSGAAADVFDGNLGIDTIDYSGSAGAITVDLTAGTASGGDAAGDVLTAFDRVVGTGLADTLSSSTTGHILEGGAGDDIYIVGSTGVSVVEGSAAGNDEVRTALTALSIASFANVEKLTYTGAAAFTGTGNSGDNILTGGTGNDVLIGGAGADQLIGGGGTDTASYANAATGVTLDLKSGVNSGDAAGDTFSSIEKFLGSANNDIFLSSAGADVVDGSGGTDTVDYGNSATAVTVDLSTGTGTAGEAAGDTYASIERVQGSAFGDTITGSTLADQLYGGAGNDVLNGGSGNDFIEGGQGADTINGGSFVDTASYAGSASAVTVDLTTGTTSGGDAAGDTLTSIEWVLGSAFSDTLTASVSGHTLEGGAGNDTYVVGGTSVSVVEAVGGGTDEVQTALAALSIAAFTNVENLTYTGSAAFTGTGNAGANTITGGIGGDTLIGGAGADQLSGGLGSDTASYATSSAAVTIDTDMISGTGDAAGDSYSSIENFLGSDFGDTFLGNSNTQTFTGGLGFDIASYRNSGGAISIDRQALSGTGAAFNDDYQSIEAFEGTSFADTFLGSIANDFFIGGSGADSFDGRDGADTVIYLDSAVGITANIATNSLAGGTAQGDSLVSVENLIGTNFADTITGNALGNKLEGGNGSDTIYGGDGDDIIYGNLGTDVGGAQTGGSDPTQTDILYGEDGNDSLSALGGTANQLRGGAGDDALSIANGIAFGGDGNDNFNVFGSGSGTGASAFGEAGNDYMRSYFDGFLFGGEGSDDYIIDATSSFNTVVQDDGSAGIDRVFLPWASTAGFTQATSADGRDLILKPGIDSGTVAHGLTLKDWYVAGASNESIEQFFTSDLVPLYVA